MTIGSATGQPITSTQLVGRSLWRRLRSANWKLMVGLVLLLGLLLFVGVGRLLVDESSTQLGAGGFTERPLPIRLGQIRPDVICWRW